METDIKEMKNSIDTLTTNVDSLTKSVDTIAKTTAMILETMATKVDIEKIYSTMATKDDLLSFKLELKTEISQVATELKDFKQETRDSFVNLEKSIKENEDSMSAVVADYHPHIIKLEEKVFGKSSLAEA